MICTHPETTIIYRSILSAKFCVVCRRRISDYEKIGNRSNVA